MFAAVLSVSDATPVLSGVGVGISDVVEVSVVLGVVGSAVVSGSVDGDVDGDVDGVTSTVVCCTSVVVETTVVVDTTVVAGSGDCGAVVVGCVGTTGAEVGPEVGTAVAGGCGRVPALVGLGPLVEGAVAMMLCVTEVLSPDDVIPVLRLPALDDDEAVEDPDARAGGFRAELVTDAVVPAGSLDAAGEDPGVVAWRLLDTFACSVVRVASSCCFPSASATLSTSLNASFNAAEARTGSPDLRARIALLSESFAFCFASTESAWPEYSTCVSGHSASPGVADCAPIAADPINTAQIAAAIPITGRIVRRGGGDTDLRTARSTTTSGSSGNG